MQEKKLGSLIQQVQHGIRPNIYVGGGLSGINKEPIVQLVNTIIELAVGLKASDIHIEPMPEKARLRFRIDGLLMVWPENFPTDAAAASGVSPISRAAAIAASEL